MITINDKIYLSPKESSDFLKVSMPTIWRWIESGKLKKVSLSPKKIYIKKEDLEDFFK